MFLYWMARYSLVVRALDFQLSNREFDFRPPRLVIGWVTVFGRANHLSISLAIPRPTQPPTVSGTGNEYRPKCGDALRLGSKLIPYVDKRIGG